MPNENLSTGFTQFQVTTNLDVTITAGSTVSNGVDLSATYLVGLIIPSNFDGTQLQFRGSRDGAIYAPINNTLGARLLATVVAGENTAIVPSDFAMWRFIKLVSVTTQATTDTIIGLVTRPLS